MYMWYPAPAVFLRSSLSSPALKVGAVEEYTRYGFPFSVTQGMSDSRTPQSGITPQSAAYMYASVWGHAGFGRLLTLFLGILYYPPKNTPQVVPLQKIFESEPIKHARNRT